jgi:hypothetical protein
MHRPASLSHSACLLLAVAPSSSMRLAGWGKKPWANALALCAARATCARQHQAGRQLGVTLIRGDGLGLYSMLQTGLASAISVQIGMGAQGIEACRQVMSDMLQWGQHDEVTCATSGTMCDCMRRSCSL